ncbi:MAG TPA: hypothetical protein VJB63_00585, partial [Patescibacteria group bacterium]|nr:hypothetical protein [Patescibacteria group bacterium]
DWKVYKNEKYGFELMFPNDWTSTISPYSTATTGKESSFILGNILGISGISFTINQLGSEALGSIYRSAKNLDQYTNLLVRKDEKGNIFRKFVKEITVSGRRALWFEVYQWEVDKQSFMWVPAIYFQDQNNIYEINPSGSITVSLLNQILSTFKFIE